MLRIYDGFAPIVPQVLSGSDISLNRFHPLPRPFVFPLVLSCSLSPFFRTFDLSRIKVRGNSLRPLLSRIGGIYTRLSCSSPHLVISHAKSARLEPVYHIEGDLVSGVSFITPKAKSRTESELRCAWIAFVGVTVPVFCFGCSEHFVVGQPIGCGTLVAIHSVGFVMGDFLEFVAELCKLVRQWRVK